MKKLVLTFLIAILLPTSALAAPQDLDADAWSEVKQSLLQKDTHTFDSHSTLLYKQDGLEFNTIIRTAGDITFDERVFKQTRLFFDFTFKDLLSDQNMRVQFDVNYTDFVLKAKLRSLKIFGEDISQTNRKVISSFIQEFTYDWHTITAETFDSEVYKWFTYSDTGLALFAEYQLVIQKIIENLSHIDLFRFAKYNTESRGDSYRFYAQRFRFIQLLQKAKVQLLASTSNEFDTVELDTFESLYRHVVRYFRYFNWFYTGEDDQVDQIFGIARYDNPPERLVVLSYKIDILD